MFAQVRVRVCFAVGCSVRARACVRVCVCVCACVCANVCLCATGAFAGERTRARLVIGVARPILVAFYEGLAPCFALSGHAPACRARLSLENSGSFSTAEQVNSRMGSLCGHDKTLASQIPARALLRVSRALRSSSTPHPEVNSRAKVRAKF